MSRRFVSLLPWIAFAVVLGLGTAGQYLEIQNGRAQRDADYFLLVAFIVFAAFGAFIASRLPSNPVGWLFLITSGLPALGFFGTEYAVYAVRTDPGSLPAPHLVGWFGTWTWIPGLTLMATFLFLLFPDGHLPSRRWRPVAWFSAAILVLGTIGYAFSEATFGVGEGIRLDNPVGFIPNPDGGEPVVEVVLLPLLLVAVAASMASLFFRYRGARGEQRQQLKWFLYAAAFLAITLFTGELLPVVLNNVLFAVAIVAVPAAAAIAVLKYRLYDIDVVINRTVVYGLLAAFVTLIYVGIVVGIGALIGSRGNVFLSIVATALIALAFQPMRERARRLANRLVYGKRATPYEAMSEFAERVAGTYSLDDVLPRMARIAAEGTGADRVEVWVRVGNELRLEASWPTGNDSRSLHVSQSAELPSIPDVDRAVPVTQQSEVLGAIAVAMPRTESLTPAGEKLLEDLASQAGLVLRNVRLIEELRASRQRLVAAQDEERRRLERNLHDGAQQQLVALAVKMRLVESLARKDPAKAEAMAAQAKAETQEALENLRDLARGIYPPLLADKGLAVALESQARKSAVPVEVEPDGIGRFPQEAEAAVYFCVLEALQNVAKYANAERAVIRLSEEDGRLMFSVSDDGRGFDSDATPKGSGLQNMADRLDALGGSIDVASSPGSGTTITGRIPVDEGAR